MNNFSLIKKFLFAFAAILLIASCDDEFDELNSNIIDGDIHTGQERFEGSVVAYDRPTGGVQTSSATTNFLGIYDNPVLGKTTASYITQLELATTNLNTKFTDHMVVDSVWVYIPYYNQVVSSETENDTTRTTYSLNQVYGDSTAQFNLKIRKNDFYLRATDPASGGSAAQYYYSDQKALFEPYQVTNLRADSQPINGFSNDEIRRAATYVNDENVVTPVTAEVLQPGLFVYLDKQFFKDYIISDAGEPNLVNNTVFKNYFRGISFTPEQVGSTSAMAALNFAAGYVKIKYTQDDYDSNGDPVLDENGIVKRESILMTLNMTGAHVNLFEFEPKLDYNNAITNSNTVNGDDRLYIKGGGDGSIAMIDILKDEELATLRNMLVDEANPEERDTILINEANLIFYLDEDKMDPLSVKLFGDSRLEDNPTPYRIYLYDVNNKRPVYDYLTDGSTFADSRYNRSVYGGIPFKDSRGRTAYKIRLTNHISNLIKYADSTNVKLGLAVTNAIDVNSNAQLHTPFTETWGGNTVNVSAVPFANAMNPFGLVLFGPNIPFSNDPDSDYAKRLRLEIYYTKKRD
ncbi:DUF4270 domain-containing protein [Flavobacterium sp. RHBU_24]|uniref:DUF4270 domain-containing protein n=1 Tax=Flavobacterium sp. RHBU_24 TaxID=3391185 RepID=UPI0039848F58